MQAQVRWILARQTVLALLLALGAWVVLDANAGASVLVGGSIGVIANLGYVVRAMRMTSGSDPVKAYRAQAAGEGFKFVLTFAGFALVFLGYKEVAVLPLFLGYASTIVIFWVALLKQR